MLLTGNRLYSLHELMERFDVSDRTVYRHLEIIKRSGFVLISENGSYRLASETTNAQTLQKLLYFSEEEAYILYKTLSLIDGKTPVKERLVRKLNTLYDFRVLSTMQDKSGIEIVSKLGKAIRNKRQVMLCAYRSSNSDNISDRIVEPFEFLPDYSAIWCYDKESGSCKQFKVARISDLQILATGIQHEPKHIVPFVDAFRMAAEKPIANVNAHLSLKAYNLLTEEFPLAETHVQPSNGKYMLNIPVADFNGVGRFVLGLLDEVHVVGPAAFLTFLKKRVKMLER